MSAVGFGGAPSAPPGLVTVQIRAVAFEEGGRSWVLTEERPATTPLGPRDFSPGVIADPPGTTPSDAVDTIDGSDGGDLISGGGGNDTISDANTPGLAAGNSGNVIAGNGGSDEIWIYALGTGGANPVSNIAYGDDGNDSISLQISDIEAWWGQYEYGDPPTGAVALYGGTGNDILSSYTFTSGVQVSLYGEAGADLLRATSYFAEFDSRLGANNPDYLYGGDGNDTYEVREAQDVVTEDAGKGFDTIRAIDASYILPANVEDLELAYEYYPSEDQVRGIGNALSNTIIAPQEGSGLDQVSYVIDGMAGSDVLYGSGGAIDTLSGGAGDDTIYGKQAGGSFFGDYVEDAP